MVFAYGKGEFPSSIRGEEDKQSTDMLLVGEKFWDSFFGQPPRTEGARLDFGQ